MSSSYHKYKKTLIQNRGAAIKIFALQKLPTWLRARLYIALQCCALFDTLQDIKFIDRQYESFMAIYHFSGQVISRSQGRSAVAAAAYRSGSMLQDERYGQTYDYRGKQGIAHSEIILPTGAPEWLRDRETLWNAVEKNERRKDSQLAREFVVSLPNELTFKQNTILIREFTQQEFVDLGMIADLSIHDGVSKNGDPQPHAHIMLTMREVGPNGFGQKAREWNDKALLEHWRQRWAEIANQHLAYHDIDVRLDHRSFVDQGIKLIPQNKIGKASRITFSEKMDEHLAIARKNGEILFADPTIALHALTQQQSTFTQDDLARFVNRHTADAEQFTTVFTHILACPALKHVGQDAKGKDRYTSIEHFELEQEMLENARELTLKSSFPTSQIKMEKIAAVKGLTAEQKAVLTHIVKSNNLSCIVGYAGTGKSYLLGAAREAWESQGYNVIGATLAGIAAENLQASSGIDSRTLASRFYYWDKGEQLLTNKDILVLDEAGMIGSRQMARVIAEAKRAGAKVVLIGDPQQLQSIEAGAAFRGISEQSPTIELTEIRRQKGWQAEATKALAEGNVSAALDAYKKHDNVHQYDSTNEAQQALISLWQDVRITTPETTQIILSYTRQDVGILNTLARDLRKSLGELTTDYSIQTAQGVKDFSIGERLYFLKNDSTMNVKNGSLGTLMAVRGNILEIKVDGNDNKEAHTIQVDTKIYNHLTYGYAATIHKAQGVTVDRAYLYASKFIDSHAAYVALSRHRQSVDLFYSISEFEKPQDLVTGFSRDRSKDISLDYSSTVNEQQKFAERYGIGNSNNELIERSKSEKLNWADISITNELKALQDSKDPVIQGILRLHKRGLEKGFTSTIEKGLEGSLSQLLNNPITAKALQTKANSLYRIGLDMQHRQLHEHDISR